MFFLGFSQARKIWRPRLGKDTKLRHFEFHYAVRPQGGPESNKTCQMSERFTIIDQSRF